MLTKENKEFISEIVASKQFFNFKTPLNTEIIVPDAQWTPMSKRTGLIGKKIGVYPMWLKNGQKVITTLIQVYNTRYCNYIELSLYFKQAH